MISCSMIEREGTPIPFCEGRVVSGVIMSGVIIFVNNDYYDPALMNTT